MKVEHAKRIGAAVCVDFEPLDYTRLTVGIAKSRAAAAARQLREYAAKCQDLCRTARVLYPTAFVVLYSNFPIDPHSRYDATLIPYVNDNAKLFDSGFTLDADALAIGAYLHSDDMKGMTPEGAADWTKRRIAIAAPYQLRKIVYLAVHYEGSRVRIPADQRRAQVAVCEAAGLDYCFWADGMDEASAAAFGREVAK